MADSTWGERLDGFDPNKSGFERLPDGIYNLVIRSVKVKTSTKGDPQLGVTVAVVDGPLAGKSGYDSLTWTANDDARRIFLQQLAVVGVSVDWLKEHNPSWEQIAAAMVGRPFTSEVGSREWPVGSGQMRNNYGIWKHYAGPPLGELGVPAAPAVPATPAPAAPVPPQAPPAPAPVAPPPTPAATQTEPAGPLPVAPPPTPVTYSDDEAPF